MTHDWEQTKQRLMAGSMLAFKAFFAVHPIQTVRAIGYTWEWGQGQACFYCVASTQTGLEKAVVDANRYRDVPLSPEEALQVVRWDAGYFPFPAGLTGPNDEMGAAWEAEAARLYDVTVKIRDVDYNDAVAYAEYDRQYTVFLADLVTTCCEALAQLHRDGVFDGGTALDFYVGSTDENGEIVKDRDARVRGLLASL